MAKAEERISQNFHRCNMDGDSETPTGECSRNADETIAEKYLEAEREAAERRLVEQLLEEREQF